MMLWGLLGALIPITIHMSNRRRAPRIPFAALDFLLLTDKRLARKLKLKQLLVLLFRTLLVAAVPLALAKPFLPHPADGELNLTSPSSVVIIVDNSGSMNALHDGDSLFERALAEAGSLMKEAGTQTNFALISLASPVTLHTSDLVYDRGALRLALKGIERTFGPGDLNGALAEAERILAQSDQHLHQVVLLSDNTHPLWEPVSRPWRLKDLPQSVARDLGAGTAPNNAGILSLSVLPVLGAGPESLRAEGRVKNFDTDALVTEVRLTLGGQDFLTPIEVPAGGEAVFELNLTLAESGPVRGVARLESRDGLAQDDRFYFTVNRGGAVDVLVVNGAPRDQRLLDETFFLRPALRPVNRAIRAQFLNRADLEGTSLEGKEVVILANVGQLSPKERLRLQRFVSQGGGLFIAAGDQFTPSTTAAYGSLLPAPIRSLKEVVRRASPSADVRALRPASVASSHPLMAPFSRLREASLFRALIYKYALVEDLDERGAQVLARLSNGAPLLLEGALGSGRILFLTTTLDRDWSDLALRSSYLPLLQSSVAYLAGQWGPKTQPQGSIGGSVLLRVPSGEGPLHVEGPGGSTYPVSVGARDTIRFDQGRAVGHYVLKRSEGNREGVPFALNADRSESDLRRVSAARVKELLNRPGEADAPHGSIQPRGAEAHADPSRSNLWPFILVALFGLLLAEGWVVVREVR